MSAYDDLEAMAARELKELRELNAELLEALIKLTNEALASVELARPCIGNTNANCLFVRATEGRRLIAKAAALRPTPDELMHKLTKTLNLNQIHKQLEEDYKQWTMKSRYSHIVSFIRMCETQEP